MKKSLFVLFLPAVFFFVCLPLLRMQSILRHPDSAPDAGFAKKRRRAG